MSNIDAKKLAGAPMTDKIHGYEDEHRVNHYGLRFRSDGQNTTPLNGGTTQQDEASALSGCNQTSRDGLGDSCERSINGGDEPSLSEGLDRVIHPAGTHGNSATIPCTAGVTSSTSEPTYTREELVTMVQELCANGWEYGTHPREKAARIMNKLIAIGAVRVK